jgi:hypothetical protein
MSTAVEQLAPTSMHGQVLDIARGLKSTGATTARSCKPCRART